MQPLLAGTGAPGPTPLTSREDLWDRALELAGGALATAVRGGREPPSQVFAVVAAAARLSEPRASELTGHLRRLLVRSELGSEGALRCLRALARAGEKVDVARLSDSLVGSGRIPRIALAALAEVAARGHAEALALLADALDGAMRTDAALFLSSIASEEALDALAARLRLPGSAGVHAAAALAAVEDDPFAFELLCERLCEPADAALAARALWGAAPEGRRLMEAEAALARWARRGVARAESGRLVAAAMLTAGGIAQDYNATLRALASEDDELTLVGAQAAYALGDAERAHGAVVALLRRGPLLAGQAFGLLARWADLGDAHAATLVRTTLEKRPIDLARAAIFEALAQAMRPSLHGVVARALSASDAGGAVEAARALARLREPPSIVPSTWL